MQKSIQAARNCATTVALCFALSFVVGCSGYPEVSPRTYEYATALYNVASRKAADRLEPLSEQIAASLELQEISRSEAKWLTAILEDASEGNWKEASKAARAMMEDQVRVAEK